MDNYDRLYGMVFGSQLAIRNMEPQEKRETFFEQLDVYKKKASIAVETLNEEPRYE